MRDNGSNLDDMVREVLDHGMVRLLDHMGDDLAIARSARVSYDAAWRQDSGAGDISGDAKLINYLMKNRHTTPFEAVQFSFEVKAPLFVVRQWMRHRTWSYNEVSARYTPLPATFYIPTVEAIGKQSKGNKQMRDIVSLGEMSFTEKQDSYEVTKRMTAHNTEAFKLYNSMLDEGVPRELARTVLPLATYTHFFCQVNLHNLFHFLRLRLHEHAQYEIRVFAQALLELIDPIVPVAVKAFRTHQLGEA